MKKLIYSQEDLDLILSLENENKDKEIERLKKSEKEALDTLESATYENIDLTNEVDRLNNIINEAIEYIEKYIYIQPNEYGELIADATKLLEILKGEDKE